MSTAALTFVTVSAAPPAVSDAAGVADFTVPTGGEHVALLVKIVLVRGWPDNLWRAAIVRGPQAHDQLHDGLRPPLCLPSIMLHMPPHLADGQEALIWQLH